MNQLPILTLSAAVAVAALAGDSRAHFSDTERSWAPQDWRDAAQFPVPPIGSARELPAPRCAPPGRCAPNPYKMGCLAALAESGNAIRDSQVAICEYFSSAYAVEALHSITKSRWTITDQAMASVASYHTPYAAACLALFPRYSVRASEEHVAACGNFASPFGVATLELIHSLGLSMTIPGMHTLSQYSCAQSVECVNAFLRQGHRFLSNELLQSCGR